MSTIVPVNDDLNDISPDSNYKVESPKEQMQAEKQRKKEAIKRQSTLPHPLKPNVVVDENHQSYFLVFGMLTGIR
eukprot:jgi/Orpsp1_1/1177823/evm.model.c7180000063006.1